MFKKFFTALIISLLIFPASVGAFTITTYNGGASTKTLYNNPINSTRGTMQVKSQIVPNRVYNPVISPSISTRAHGITPSVRYTTVPTPGYNTNVHILPTGQTGYYNRVPSGIRYNNNRYNVVRYPVNNTYNPYSGGYNVTTVQYPVVTKTTTMTNGNGLYTYSEDYIPYGYNTTTYSNNGRFLSW